MDTISVPRLAAQLGTSAARVSRALDRLGIKPRRGPRGRLLDDGQVRELRQALGVVPPVAELAGAGLSRSQFLALAGLDRRPLGVRSARALARTTGLSPTAAVAALGALEAAHLAERVELTLAEGRARRVPVWRLNRDSPRWPRLAPLIGRVELPAKAPRPAAKQVPARLRHHFWNATPSRLRLPEHADYVAARLLQSSDPEAIAWASSHLPRSAIARAAGLRGLTARERGFLRTLAGHPNPSREAADGR